MTSTLQLQIDTLNNALQVQTQILATQQQISSGLKSTNFQGLAGTVAQFASTENQLGATTSYLQNNSTLNSTLNITNTTLSQIVTAANNLQNLILQREDGAVTANSLDFSQELQSAYQSIAGLLNTNVGGQYIFSGTAINTPPLDPSTMPTTAQLGVPDNSYYNGSAQDLTATVQDGVTITTNVRADAPAIQQLMAGIAAAQQGDTTNNISTLQQAYTLVQQAVSGITSLQGQVGGTQTTLNNATSFLTTQQTYLKTLHDNLVNADIVSLSTQLATDQATLQAAFQSFANINSLQLSKYL